MSNRKSMAIQILDGLGGVSNIKELENCMTRLRVVVHDSSKVNKEALKRIQGVLSVVGSDIEPQIILGPGVADEVGDELSKIQGLNYTVMDEVEGPMMQKREAKGILSFFSQVFAPLIPVFAGTGLLFGIMKIFTLIYNLTGTQLFNPAPIASGGSVFMAVLSVLAGTFFSFLSIAVGIQSAKVMGGNPYLGLVAGGIVTNVGALNGNPMGISDLVFTNGRGGVLAAMLAGALIAIVERKVKQAIPHSLRVHLPVLISVVVVGLLTLYVLQPLAGIVTDIIANSLLWLFENAGPIGGAVIAFAFLPLVMTGLHHGLTPVHTALIEKFGYTTLYAFNSMAGGGQVGASLALYIKYKQNKKLQSAIVGGLPAGILGIGEPLIFGVTLPLGRAFLTACLGAAFGGFVCGLFPGMGAETINVSGILGALVNTMPLAYLAGYSTSIIAGFIITWVVGVKSGNLENFDVQI